VSASRTKVAARPDEPDIAVVAVVAGTDDVVVVDGATALCDEELHAVSDIATVNQATVWRTRIIA